jgi:DNA-binding IclR family transcriptional regulator
MGTARKTPSAAVSPDGGRGRTGIQSIEVGGRLLAALADHARPMMLKDLASASAMTSAKAHRYLVSFLRMGLVVQAPETGRYDLGPFALSLGLAALGRLEPVALARSAAARLRDQIDQTVAVAVWGNKGPTIVHWEDSGHALTVNLRWGGVLPMLNSAAGRCFGAYLPPAATAALVREELKAARRSDLPEDVLPRTTAAYGAILDDVRARRVARVQGALLPGVHAFCAPVFDARGAACLGLIVLGYSGLLDSRWDSPALAALQRAAAQLSGQLGAPG